MFSWVTIITGQHNVSIGKTDSSGAVISWCRLSLGWALGKTDFLLEIACAARVSRLIDDHDADVGKVWKWLGEIESQDCVGDASGNHVFADSKNTAAQCRDGDGGGVVSFSSLECVTNCYLHKTLTLTLRMAGASGTDCVNNIAPLSRCLLSLTHSGSSNESPHRLPVGKAAPPRQRVVEEGSRRRDGRKTNWKEG